MLGALVSRLADALSADATAAPPQPAGSELPHQPAAVGTGADAVEAADAKAANAGEAAASGASEGSSGAAAVEQPAAGVAGNAAESGAVGAVSSAAADAALQDASFMQQEAAKLGEAGEAAPPEDTTPQRLSQHEAAQLRSGLAKVRIIERLGGHRRCCQ